MTRDEILYMPAGMEMDALIAVNIMGWNRDGVLVVPPKDHEASVNNWCAEWDRNGCPDWMPHYSTDIAAAWEVVEVLSKDGYAPNLVNDDGGKWYLSFDGTQNLDPVSFVTAFTDVPELWCASASLAICRAALLAEVE